MRVLKVVHLEGLENRMAHELSGGQQQRVALGPRTGHEAKASAFR